MFCTLTPPDTTNVCNFDPYINCTLTPPDKTTCNFDPYMDCTLTPPDKTTWIVCTYVTDPYMDCTLTPPVDNMDCTFLGFFQQDCLSP